MTTARDLAKGILRKISVLGAGSQLDSSEADDVLIIINMMLASWSVGGNVVYSETIETFPLINGTKEYTIGLGGDFNTERPVDIVSAYVTQGSTDYQLYKLDRLEYSKIYQKDVGAISDTYYYDGGFPLAKIKLYPVPQSISSITLYSNKPLSSFTDLDTVYNMPPEYESAIIYNGAVWIAPEYEREASSTVKKIANQTINVIRAGNTRNDKYTSEIGIGVSNARDFNIYGGSSR